MKRDIYYLWATGIVFLYFGAVSIETFDSYLAGQDLSGSFITPVITADMTYVFLMFAVLFSSRIAGWDFTDKTLNYEIIYGHKRSSVYFGRAIVGIGTGLIRSAAVAALIVILPTAAFGWGWSVPVSEIVLRYSIIALELIRLMAFVIMVSTIARSNVAGAFAGFAAFFIPVIVTAMLNLEEEKVKSISFLSSCLSISEVSSFENYTTDYILGKDVTIFLDRLEPQFSSLLAVTAILFTAVYLLIGYAVFRKADIH